MNAIDIIVPTYRLNENQLLDICHLPRPEGFSISYFIISDNPDVIIPESITRLQNQGGLNLLIHQKNRGPSAARNTGIRASSCKWILFLDDDIKPREDLLLAYAQAIRKNEAAIGFAGLTVFPEPFNTVTRALAIGGWISHFTAAGKYPQMKWAPTSNILLNREKMDTTLFDEALKKSGEDIDLLVRNSLALQEDYTSVPGAVVFHPWWNQGAVQTKRMWRYGEGASEIARKKPLRDYTFLDFTNSAESLMILVLLMPFAWLGGFFRIVLILSGCIILAEYLTNWIRGIIIGKTYSPVVAFHLMWAKNCYESGFLVQSLRNGYWQGFARRMDMGFNRPHPGAFRTNRWKIIKLILVAVLFLIATVSL